MSELASKHNVDLDKLRPIVRRVIANADFAAQLFDAPEQALAGYADLTANEVAVLRGISRKLVDISMEAVADAIEQESPGHEVEGQDRSEAALARGVDNVLGRAFVDTLGGHSSGGHWNAGVGNLTACCSWAGVFG